METQAQKSCGKGTKMSRVSSLGDTWIIRFRVHGKINTSLVTAKDHKRAERKAKAYPNVIGVSKARNDVFRIANDELKTFTNNLMKEIAKPALTPLAMDEFIWKRRKKRVENRSKESIYME